MPQDRPPLPALLTLGLQHVLTMFPATVFVAIITKFDVGVTLFASGLATIVALLGSGMRIPLYYGSSFSYIAAVVGAVLMTILFSAYLRGKSILSMLPVLLGASCGYIVAALFGLVDFEVGILLNLVFLIFPPKSERPPAQP